MAAAVAAVLLLANVVLFPVLSQEIAVQDAGNCHCRAAAGSEREELQGSEREELQGLLRRQEEQVSRLEESVRALQQVLERLDVGCDKVSDSADVKIGDASENGDGVLTPRAGAGGDRGSLRVEKYRPAWADRFQFLAAIKVSSDVTCIAALPPDEEDGVSRFVAVGDEFGRVYVVLAHSGDALADFPTGSASAVTAMLSYSLGHETILVTGHADGAVLLHRVHEAAGGDESGGLLLEHVRRMNDSGESEGVKLLEVHQIGKTRYLLCVDEGKGRLRVFLENGTFHGAVEPWSRFLAVLKQRLLFLTEHGVVALDLRTMTVRNGTCDGLNGSSAVAYTFDAAERSKGYGFTKEGEILHVVLMGDVTNFECRVRAKKKIEVLRGGEVKDVFVRAIKGYLIVGLPDKVLVFNATSPSYHRTGGPRHIFHATLEEIASSIRPGLDFDAQTPLVACNRDKLVAVGFGRGYVAMFRSTLPVYKPEFNTMLWSSPVLVFVVFLFAAWHLFLKKREVFSIWSSDDGIFDGSASSSAPSVSGATGALSSVVSKEDAPRDIRDRDIRDLRTGPSRRYGSPPRFPAVSQSGFGSATSTLGFRSSAVDLNYRQRKDL